ncbi:MAG: phosphatidylglycerol lysyltransferase domain-containing protein, partial [Pygmaiobacter sp.]
VLDHFFELGLVGGLLRDEGKTLAFCYGSKISDSVLCTHVEKAYHDVNGAYAVINREFARMFGTQFTYINREDDLGEEGLRKAKLSYRPAVLEKKYFAVLKTEV